MNRVYLALGSNVGDRKAYIYHAITLLSEKIVSLESAPLYESQAVGYTDQANFYNTVVTGMTALLPVELLHFVKKIEKRVGRVERFRWGPREIDIDILLYGDMVFESTDLSIPHPRMHERDFVLLPLRDLNPDLLHPATEKQMITLLDALVAEQRSVVGKVDD